MFGLLWYGVCCLVLVVFGRGLGLYGGIEELVDWLVWLFGC